MEAEVVWLSMIAIPITHPWRGSAKCGRNRAASGFIETSPRSSVAGVPGAVS